MNVLDKSVNSCNLLAYGDGQVIPFSFRIQKPNLMYYVPVGLSSTVQYSRAILVMDKNLCTNIALQECLITVFIYILTEERCMLTSGLMYPTSYFKLTVKLEQYRQLIIITR